jgi:hypothetical protein
MRFLEGFGGFTHCGQDRSVRVGALQRLTLLLYRR